MDLGEIGIGIDIEDVNRFRPFIFNKKKSLKRIFTKKELSYCHTKNDPAQHLAARFCAKEAVYKALSDINGPKLSFNEIEIKKQKNGKPEVLLGKNYAIKISLSHTSKMAICVAIASKNAQLKKVGRKIS